MKSETVGFCNKLYPEMRLIYELCRLDIKQRTAGTSFGVLWIYLNPAISMFMIWFVFYFGLRSSAGASGVYSLLVGLISWQLVSDAIVIGTGAFVEKPYLVKKIKFPLAYLPIIKVLNSLWIHLPFLAAALALSVASSNFSIKGLLIFSIIFPLYFIFLSVLVFLLSTIAVFYRDLQSVLGVVMQLIFWGTPIIWIVPEQPKAIGIVENFNPFFFVVRLYRFCFLSEKFDFQYALISFAGVSVLLFIFTKKLFGKLKEQFADVL